MADKETYLGRITSFHRGKPKFTATVDAGVEPLVALQDFLVEVPQAFDIDTATGAQLDVCGQWIGCSRILAIPIAAPWFALDDAVHGFDMAPWKGLYDQGVTLERLDDDTYRRLLKAKILANNWDGTCAGTLAVLRAFITDTDTILIVQDYGFAFGDNNVFALDDPVRGFDQGRWHSVDGSGGAPITANMLFKLDDSLWGFDAGHWSTTDDQPAVIDSASMDVIIGVAGKKPNIIDTEVLARGLLPLKAQGVRLTTTFVSVPDAPLFGLDMDTAGIAGFDVGAFGVPADVAITL